MLRATLLCLLFPALLSCSGPSRDEVLAERENQKFQQILEEYADQYFKDHPHRATEAGMHQYDGLMPAFTRERIVAHTESLRKTLNDLASIDPTRLTPDTTYDHQIFESTLRGEMLELTEIRPWLRNPNRYNDVITQSIVSLVEFDMEAPEARMKSLISRLDQIPEILEAMQANVENPAPIYVESAKEQFASTAAFLKNDLERAFAGVENADLRSQLKTSVQAASRAYEKSLTYLTGLSRTARGGHSLGPRLFQQKLFFEEMIDTTVPQLARIGEDELKRVQGQFTEAAKKVDPGRTPAQIIDSLGRDYPSADQMKAMAAGLTADARKFVIEKNLLTIPSDAVPAVRLELPYAHPLLFAHLETPGTLEASVDSFYTITLPDPSWSASRKNAYLQMLNRSMLPILSLHETFPGHYVQFLHSRNVPSRVRKVFGSEAFREGWAFYAEQMMLDEGFANHDPRLRLAQLQFELLRVARYVAAVRVHGQGTMTESDTVNFFMREAFLSRDNAEREATRAALDPGIVKQTLGKLEILRLREDYKTAKGAQFSLKEFHDELLKHGYPPLRIMRQIMLPKPETSSD